MVGALFVGHGNGLAAFVASIDQDLREADEKIYLSAVRTHEATRIHGEFHFVEQALEVCDRHGPGVDAGFEFDAAAALDGRDSHATIFAGGGEGGCPGFKSDSRSVPMENRDRILRDLVRRSLPICLHCRAGGTGLPSARRVGVRSTNESLKSPSTTLEAHRCRIQERSGRLRSAPC